MLDYSRYDEPIDYADYASEAFEEELQAMRVTFQEIISCLYLNGDLEGLEAYVDELCDLFHINKPTQALNIERKAPVFNNKMQMVNALARVANA